MMRDNVQKIQLCQTPLSFGRHLEEECMEPECDGSIVGRHHCGKDHGSLGGMWKTYKHIWREYLHIKTDTHPENTLEGCGPLCKHLAHVWKAAKGI